MSLQLQSSVKKQDVEDAYFINASVQSRRARLEQMKMSRQTNFEELLMGEGEQDDDKEEFPDHGRVKGTRNSLNSTRQISTMGKKQNKYGQNVANKQFSSCQNINQLENIVKIHSDQFSDLALIQNIKQTNAQKQQIEARI